MDLIHSSDTAHAVFSHRAMIRMLTMPALLLSGFDYFSLLFFNIFYFSIRYFFSHLGYFIIRRERDATNIARVPPARAHNLRKNSSAEFFGRPWNDIVRNHDILLFAGRTQYLSRRGTFS